MPEPWGSTEDGAQHLGKPTSYIHQHAERLGLPRHRIGQQYRYRLSEVDSWLENQE